MSRRMIILLLFTVIISCRGRRYFIVRNFDYATKKMLTLDHNYDLYSRKIYKVSNHGDVYRIKDDSANYSSAQLIEIEYLLVSNNRGNVMYFSTAPDKKQDYYQNVTLDSVINVFDFNYFHFGRLDSCNSFRFTFKNGDGERYWELESAISDTIVVKRISEWHQDIFQYEVRVGEAFEFPFKFIKVGRFSVMFYHPFMSSDTLKLVNNRIFIAEDFEVYFQFDGRIYNSLARLPQLVTQMDQTKNDIVGFRKRFVKFPADSLSDELFGKIACKE